MFGLEMWRSGKTWIGEYRYVDGRLDGQTNNGGLANTNWGAWPGSGDQNPDNHPSAQFYTLEGIKRSNLVTNDVAMGIGFNWDIVRRVSLHGRYTWLRHMDKNLPFNDYTGNVVSLELKAFF
jgi:hypothetical protein